MTHPSSLSHLPEELLLRIFSHLEYDKLLLIAQVSKEINRISSDPELWKHLFELDLDNLPFVQNTTLTLNKPSIHRRINTTMTWKQFYYESYFKQKWNPQAAPQENQTGLSPRQGSSEILRMQRTRILYIGPKKSGKSTLFYHMKFGTSFRGIYYLRKFGTVVSIDLALGSKSKKSHSSPNSTFASNFGPPEPHGSDILPADLEVHDVEDFEALPFKRNVLPDGVIVVVDSTSLADPAVVYHIITLLSSPHIGSETVPILILATKWGEENALKAAGVARMLGMWEYPNRPWRVQSCSAATLLGVRDGLQWLHAEIKDRKSWEG
eukprot:Phypoly_transcript_10238.p1 GENE.Phypoly_transcript_10238~~Phypoly_transcript_10238.p1  ORF type:complete len:323 (+),score=50.50 Phypoly_transcript_10238:134-1102(+)